MIKKEIHIHTDLRHYVEIYDDIDVYICIYNSLNAEIANSINVDI